MFEIIYKSKISSARVGRLHTPHGIIDTPNFVAVGTNGTVKALDNRATEDLQLLFCNTYHLLLQPGIGVIEKAGGLHKFINRKGPIITDSGGFQVFSLSYGSVERELKSNGKKREENSVLKITEEGVLFRSYRDGAKILLTPESSVAAQKSMGSDIIIPLDELPPYHAPLESLGKSLERTHRWEKRSLDAHLADLKDQQIYGVVHGGINGDFRKKSALFLSDLPFDGYAIGGSFGKTREEMINMLSHTLQFLPREAPLHLLGIGDLTSLNACIPLGIDTFDSSYPTRAARHGLALTAEGAIKVTRGDNGANFEPLEKNCSCYTCLNYTRAFLHHLFKAKELSAHMLITLHNINFMIRFMNNVRHKILLGIV